MMLMVSHARLLDTLLGYIRVESYTHLGYGSSAIGKFGAKAVATMTSSGSQVGLSGTPRRRQLRQLANILLAIVLMIGVVGSNAWHDDLGSGASVPPAAEDLSLCSDLDHDVCPSDPDHGSSDPCARAVCSAALIPLAPLGRKPADTVMNRTVTALVEMDDVRREQATPPPRKA